MLTGGGGGGGGKICQNLADVICERSLIARAVYISCFSVSKFLSLDHISHQMIPILLTIEFYKIGIYL